MCSTDFRVVLCEACGSEGRIDVEEFDAARICPWCEGTGGEVIKVQPIELEDLQYA